MIAINKMDQPGAKAMLNDIRTVIALDPDAERRPAIVLTEAVREEGIDTLWETLVERRDALAVEGELEERRRRNLAGEVVAAAAARARTRIEEQIAADPALAELVVCVQRRRSIRSPPSTRSSPPCCARPRRDASDPRRYRRSRGAPRRGRAGDAGALVGHAQRPRRSPRLVEGREPPADRLVQDPRRLQHDRAADRGRAGSRCRHGERRQPRAGGGVGGAPGGDRGDDLRSRGAPMAKVDAARGLRRDRRC